MKPRSACPVRHPGVPDARRAGDRDRSGVADLLRAGPRITSICSRRSGRNTILLGQIVFNASLAMLIIRARFVGMGDTLEEARFDLGAGPLSTFRQVTLPRLMPAIIAALPPVVHVLVRRLRAAGVHERHDEHVADRVCTRRCASASRLRSTRSQRSCWPSPCWRWSSRRSCFDGALGWRGRARRRRRGSAPPSAWAEGAVTAARAGPISPDGSQMLRGAKPDAGHGPLPR